MHRMSPGVERALSSARARAEQDGSEGILLSHFVLALLDEDEGRPAVLLERAGVSVPEVRANLRNLGEIAAAPAENVLFAVARAWSLAHRHDPEFLTDAFLLAVLRADPGFARAAADIGLDATRLEQLLIDTPTHSPAPIREEEHTLAVFATPTTVEMDAGRILDANFNRAREAARVLEDYCRFTLDDRYLTEQLKELRHAVAVASGCIPATLYLASRETVRDVGISVTASGEFERTSPAHVAVVNLKRLQESLRSLEEFGKVLGPELGREIEALRYRAYT